MSETKEIPLSRQQRRYNERMSAMFQKRYEGLCQSFYDFFMENPPEGEEVKEKRKEYSAKWKVYCRNNKLKEESQTLFDTFADKLFSDYQTEKEK